MQEEEEEEEEEKTEDEEDEEEEDHEIESLPQCGQDCLQQVAASCKISHVVLNTLPLLGLELAPRLRSLNLCHVQGLV